MSNALPSIRWGILATGGISTSFVSDLVLSRPNAPINHIVQALGTSSLEKGQKFVQKTFAGVGEDKQRPAIYTNYEGVYGDDKVDVVYIGTPHSLHKENCLAAIAAGKHVLCEKPFTINAREAEEVISAARSKGVFVMEAVWTRFFPLVLELQKRIHRDRVLGPIHRLFCDFGLAMDMDSVPPSSRIKDPALGAGALLDIGVYCLTQASLFLDDEVGEEAAHPAVTSSLIVKDGIDYTDGIILTYTNPPRMAILTADLHVRTGEAFMRIEGANGTVIVEGGAASIPTKARILVSGEEEVVLEPEEIGGLMYFEADAVAQDILAGRKENAIMPLAETLRMMRLMDGIRKEGGVGYPQD